jgi:hypothetical protein
MDMYVCHTNSIYLILILLPQEIFRLHVTSASCEFIIRCFNDNWTHLLLGVFATMPQTGHFSRLPPQAIVQQAICLIGEHLRIRIRGQAAFNHQHRIIVTGLKNVEAALEEAHLTKPGSCRHERNRAAIIAAWVSLLSDAGKLE